MKKRIISCIFVFVLCICFAMPAFAAGTADYVVDGADLLTDREEDALSAKLEEMSQRQKMDVVVVTTDGLDGKSAREYANDYYENNGYGYGENRDGILLLVNIADRDWWISTCGYGITVFTDAGIDYISEKFLPDLSDGNYEEAFNIYADWCDKFIDQAKSNEPYDINNLPQEPHEPLSFVWVPISIAVGFVIALISVGIMKGKLRTIRREPAADSYIRNGSMNITESRDLYLYSRLDRTARPKENKSGSSTHKSSSGTTHGGGGGKF